MAIIIDVIPLIAHLDIYPTVNRVVISSHGTSIIPLPRCSRVSPIASKEWDTAQQGSLEGTTYFIVYKVYNSL